MLKPLPGTVFRNPSVDLYEKFEFGAIFDFHGFQKRHPLDDIHPKHNQIVQGNRPGHILIATLFCHETIVITVPLGPSVFLSLFEN